MRIGITGMSGSGKTTMINSVVPDVHIIKLPEVARTFLSSDELYSKGGYELKMDSICVANWYNISIMNAAENDNTFFLDRTFLDDYALMHLYFGRSISLEKIQEQINRLNKEGNREFVFDSLVFTQHSTDREFLEKNVFNDKQRKNSKHYDSYIEMAEKFNAYIQNAYHQLDGLTKKVHYVNAFNNSNFLQKLVFQDTFKTLADNLESLREEFSDKI